MRYLKLFFGVLFVSVISFSSIAAQTPLSTISIITLEENYARINMVEMMGVSNGVGNTCNDKSYYYLDLSGEKNKGQLSVILAAKASGSKVAFRVDPDVCVGEYAKILHTYWY